MTYKELTQRQQWTLSQKIDHSLGVIDEFASRFSGQVFVSFSGGKDSCVMLSLVEVILPQVQCVFVQTGCEMPAVVRFVREMQADHNIRMIRPRKTMKEIFSKCGFPLVSKEVSHDIENCRKNPYGISARKKLWLGNPNHIPLRWMYLLNEPYEVSDRCCYHLKKAPVHKYIHDTRTYPFVGILASESRMRSTSYLRRGGCNSFDTNVRAYPTSWPLAIWNDEDIWAYIRDRNLKLPEVYALGANRTGCMGCGFGIHRSSTALDTLRRLYPRWYDTIMDYENNGIRYGDAIQKVIDKSNGNDKDIQVVG